MAIKNSPLVTKYKEMLDDQIQTNKHFRMYGNMTKTEKEMNRFDLKAYKAKDNNQY